MVRPDWKSMLGLYHISMVDLKTHSGPLKIRLFV
ncbi:unnamed protein product, partial [Rotaria sordida]